MSHMSIGGPRKPITPQIQPPKPQVPQGGGQGGHSTLSNMYSQVAQNALKTKPHH